MKQDPSFSRLSLLIGPETSGALWETGALVFGLGGVGSWAAEALVRSGVGRVTLVDFDTVERSNINRQVEATRSSVGELKTEALKKRLDSINPDCVIRTIPLFFSHDGNDTEQTARRFGIEEADYVIDAIDSLESKLDLIEAAAFSGVTLYSSMGMAGRLDPTRIAASDIWKTSGCPLARRVREGLRKRRFKGNFTAVYSEEPVRRRAEQDGAAGAACQTPGSVVTVTAAAGMILAGLVIQDVYRNRHG